MSYSSDIESDPLEIISSNEEVILKNQDIIDTAIEENTENATRMLNPEDLIFGVQVAVSPYIDDDDAHELGHAILHVVTNYNPESSEKLRKLDVSDGLIDFFKEISMKYAEESSIPLYRATQGENYYTSVDTDLVLRGFSSRPGIDYNFTIRHSEEFKLTVSLNSNLNLIGLLIYEHSRALEEFGGDAIEYINSGLLDQIKQDFDELVEEVETMSDQNGGPKSNDNS